MSAYENPPEDDAAAASAVQAALLYDTPLLLPDQDRLGRADFARFLAQAILRMDAEEGFVFALNGPWGSGKTTVINFTLHFLKADQQSEKQVVVVRFNPWWFSGREQLLNRFFRELRATLGGRDVPAALKQVGKALDVLSKAISPLSFIPGAGAVVAPAQTVTEALAKVLKATGASKDQDAYSIRAHIDKLLQKQTSRILVVIDDIDRLTAEEIRQIFQLVKAVADFPKTIYLLAFDRNAVIQALENVQGGLGEDYLSKIVQAPFDLPPPDRRSLQQLLFQQLDQVLLETPSDLFDPVDWGNVFHGGIDQFIGTPRDVKRFVNILRPAYPIVKGEVNAVDFLGIEALRIFTPEVHSFVATNKDLLAGPVDYLPGTRGRPERQKKIFDAVLEVVPEYQREAAKAVMEQLFPRWAAAYGAPIYPSSWLSEWRKKRRICSPDVFDVYFRLALLPGDIGATEMRAIMALVNEPEAFAGELLRLAGARVPGVGSRVRAFLERFPDFGGVDIGGTATEPVLRAFFQVGDQLFEEEEQDRVLYLDSIALMGLIAYDLLKRLPTQEARFELLARLLSDAQAVSVVMYVMATLTDEHRERNGEPPARPEGERTIGAGRLSELQGMAIERIRWASSEGVLHDTPKLRLALYCTAEWVSEDEAKEYVATLIRDDLGLADYLGQFLWVGSTARMEDRVSRRIWGLDLDRAQQFLSCDVAELLPRCQKILNEGNPWLTGRKRRALEEFVQQQKESADQGRAGGKVDS